VRKKREEIEEAERVKKSKVVMTFDLIGRKVTLKTPLFSACLKLELEDKL
jgi:hypothetical protein